MDKRNIQTRDRTSFYDGLLYTTISIVFILILFGVFKPSGNFIKNFLIGTIGFSVYGYSFALLVLGIFKIFSFNKSAEKKQVVYFSIFFILVILFLHVISTPYNVYLLKGETFTEGYKNYLIRCWESPRVDVGTAGGLVAGIFVYPLYFVSRIASYVLYIALILLLAAVFVKTYFDFGFNFKKSSKAPRADKHDRHKKKILIQENVGDDLMNQDIKGNELSDEIKQRRWTANKKIDYKTIEEEENEINGNKLEDKVEQDMNYDDMSKEQKKAAEFFYGKADASSAYIDPNAGNIDRGNSQMNENIVDRNTAFDILFNRKPIRNDSQEVELNNNKVEETEEFLDPKDAALRSLYPNVYKTQQSNNDKKESDKKVVNAKKETIEKIENESNERVLTKEEEIKKRLMDSYTSPNMIKSIEENMREGRIENNIPKGRSEEEYYRANMRAYQQSFGFKNEEEEIPQAQEIYREEEPIQTSSEFVVDSRIHLNKVDLIEDDVVLDNGYMEEGTMPEYNRVETSSFDEIIRKSNNERYREEIQALEEEKQKMYDDEIGVAQQRKERSDKGGFHNTSKNNDEEKTLNRFAPIQEQVTEQEPVIVQEEEVEKKKLIRYSKYVPPSEDLLVDYSSEVPTDAVESQKQEIIDCFAEFGFNITIADAVVGPTFTRFKIELPPSISVKRIAKLDDDLQYKLGVESVIIQAPIPGERYVGVELPNKKRGTVSFKSVLQSSKFKNKDLKLGFVIGKDVNGDAYVGDLAKMPHLLIAGATGAGKSVGINCLITSFIYKYPPEYLRMILIDPKQVELSMYQKLPHMLIPDTISNPKEVCNMLDWAIDEMENRYELFLSKRCQNIAQYNSAIDGRKEQKLPYIVIIVDEVADIMMVMKSRFNDRIQRLTQKSRAAGIHVVLATQRPSVDVITGVIKANIPGRMAFTTTSATDSVTILGCAGAEKLLRNGDMLYLDPKYGRMVRVQGAFIDATEINPITDFIRENNDTYFEKTIEDRIKRVEEEKADNMERDIGANGDKDLRLDPIFADALQYFISVGKASASSLQVKFGVGYQRATRYLLVMKEYGYIGDNPNGSSKGSEVIITQREFDEIFGALSRPPENF